MSDWQERIERLREIANVTKEYSPERKHPGMVVDVDTVLWLTEGFELMADAVEAAQESSEAFRRYYASGDNHDTRDAPLFDVAVAVDAKRLATQKAALEHLRGGAK